MKVFFKGLHACLLRRFDMIRYQNYAMDCGHQVAGTPDDADLILVWTCAFRQDFCDNSIALSTGYRDKYGADRVVMCGCLPGINEKLVQEKFGDKYFKWREEEAGLAKLFGEAPERRIVSEPNICSDIHEYRRLHPDENTSHYDQFIKLHISEGCPHDCLYCAEKIAFPPYKSFPFEQIVAECRTQIEKCDTRRVVVIGDTSGCYGRDTGSSLDKLLDAIIDIDPDITLGINNINPADYLQYLDYITGLLKAGKIHLLAIPIQSASTRVLKHMNRTYTKDDLEAIFTPITEAGFKEVETHIVAGYPTETADEFLETVDFLSRHKPKHVLASGYMDNCYIDSYRLEGKVSADEIHRRLMLIAEQMQKLGVICNYDGSKYYKQKTASMQ